MSTAPIRDPSGDLVENIFPPNQVHIIGGSPGAGKTRFIAWLAEHCLNGKPFLGRNTNAPPWWGTMIVDRDADCHRQSWRAAGMEPSPYYCLTEDATLDPWLLEAHNDGKSDYGLLLKGLDILQAPPGGVLVIDVANYFSGDYRMGYNKGFARGWALNKLARERELTILAVMHGGKQKRFDAYLRLIDRIIANSGFLGAVGTKAYLASPEETDKGDGLQDFAWQSHYAPTESFRLRSTLGGLYEMVEKLTIGKGNSGGAAVAREEWDERWAIYMPWFPPEGAANYIPTMELMARAADLDISKRTIERDLAAMEEARVIVRVGNSRGKWQRVQAPQAIE